MPRPLIIVVCESVPTQRVREGPAVAVLDHAAEELEVDLVDDAGAWRDDLQAVEALPAPAQEGVALAIAVELELGVAAHREAGAELVDLHRVVDDELGGRASVDARRVAAQVAHRVAHRCEVDDDRHAREVLLQDARRPEGDLAARLVRRDPARDGLDRVARHRLAVLVAQQVLEQDPERVGKAGDVVGVLQCSQAHDLVLAAADAERRPRAEAIRAHPCILPDPGASAREESAAEYRFLLGVDVTEETFQTAVVERSAELPVVVDFWAEWCGPCRALGPVLEREAEQRAGRVELVKVDVDANPRLAQEYGISGIPAVKAFRNGRVADEFVGVRSPQSVAAFLDALTEPSEGERLLESLRENGSDPEVLEALEAGDHERAFQILLGRIDGADEERRDEVRRVMLALFDELGPEHELTQRYRRRLAAALF